jgi:hypothetical protein
MKLSFLRSDLCVYFMFQSLSYYESKRTNDAEILCYVCIDSIII